MKILSILAITSIAALTITSASAQIRKRPAVKKSIKENKRAERSAAREEFRNDRKDTHGAQAEVGKDTRPENFEAYHKQSISRISVLLKAGKITEAQGSTFKLKHTEITTAIKQAKEENKLTSGKKAALRNDLDELNDAINLVTTKGDQESKRTPILNQRQNHYEELIEFGERSKRLSTGEASKLRREVKRLADLESRLKSGSELSQKEREKLHEEMLKVQKELKKELTD